MLGQRRNVYDIIVEIVEGCLEPTAKTNLYYKIKTSGDVLYRLINTAIRFKLIKNIGNKYQTTQKGKEFLERWAQLQTFLKEE